MNYRERWKEFICSPTRAGRHLASIGTAVGSSIAEAIDTAELEAFLIKLRDQGDIQILADIIDLLREEYLTFVTKDLPTVLDHLSNEMIHVEEVIGPAVIGNPRWDRTILGRITGSIPYNRYVTRTSHRSFALPENVLLRWLVDHLGNTIRHISRRIGADALPPRLSLILTRCEEALRHYWLSNVPAATGLEYSSIVSAERHRRPEYRRAATLARTRNALNARDPSYRWHAILMLLAVGWLEPISDDDLFELYGLVLVLEVLSSELGFGEPIEYGLLLRDRSYVAAFEVPNGTIRVYFDQSPSKTLGIVGRYIAVRDAHDGILGSDRRPDIMAIFTPHDHTAFQNTVLIEIKKTTDGRYLSDSVYKAFGYLYDFQSLWSHSSKHPKIIMLVPESVSIREGITIPDVLVISGDDHANLARGLSVLTST